MKSEQTLLAMKKEGLFKRTPSVVSFFEDELLITLIDTEKNKQLIKQKKDEAKALGKGFLKTAFAGMNILNEYTQNIADMDKALILKENTTSIKKDTIKDIKYKPAFVTYDDENNNSPTQGKLIIKLENEKIKFTHSYENKNKYIKEYLNK